MSPFCFSLPLAALVVPALFALVQHEHSFTQVYSRSPLFELRADTTCPALRPEAEGVLDRFLLGPRYENSRATYGLTGVDTSEVITVEDPGICMALDSTFADAIPDSTLIFIQSRYDRSYFASESFYYGVDLLQIPDSNSYSTTGWSDILVFGKNYSFKRDFLF